jgi:MtN3 and saliva related transmembrane protein
MVVSLLAASASAWGVLMGLSPVLQIRRMLRQRSSREVSLGYFAILLAGFVLWISYGIAAGNMWLVVPNSIALLVGLTLVAVALRLRRSIPAPAAAQQPSRPGGTGARPRRPRRGWSRRAWPGCWTRAWRRSWG